MKSFEEIYSKVGKNTLVDARRFRSIYDLCAQVELLPGGTAEVGVYKGGTAYMISRALPSAVCWLFDTFEGLPEASPEHDLHSKGDFSDVDEKAVRAFLESPNVSIHKGIFPQGHLWLNMVEPTFKLVHLDVDLYQSTLDCLEYFYPRMVPGGVIITDDYEWKGTPGVTKAFNEFFEGKPEVIIRSTPVQAYVVKV